MTTIKKLIDLSGRRALITGASGGLGKMIASTLAELGADLILIDQEKIDLDNLKSILTKKWEVKVDCYVCDLEQEGQRKDLISFINQTVNNLNILINNAAFVGTSKLEGWSVPFEQQTIETWRRAFEVNLLSSFHLCQGLMSLLKNSKGANIINISSIYGFLGPDWNLYEGTNMSNPAAYSVSKGGVIQLTKWLAATVAPSVRVNCISPGGIFRNQSGLFINRYEAKTPLNRMATEEDFCGAIAYLATDMSLYVTGINLKVDGGWSVY
jgi:NAD(P)-dependent dehydrogenase (short-subunit alcohol dehydrogenase family)